MNRWMSAMAVAVFAISLGCQNDVPQGADVAAVANGQQVVLTLPHMT